MRLLGIDYGDHYVGLALSDPTGTIASPHSVLYREDEANLKDTVRKIRALCEEEDIRTIVLGYPLNMNDTVGPRAEKSEAFKRRLERDLYRVEVILWDERLTTKQAEIPLLECHMNREARKAVVDKMSAALILQSYMDEQKQKAFEAQLKKEREEKEPDIELDIPVILYDPAEDLSMNAVVADAEKLRGITYVLLDFCEDDEDGEEDEDDGNAVILALNPEESAFTLFRAEEGVNEPLNAREGHSLSTDDSRFLSYASEVDEKTWQELYDIFMVE